MRRLEFLQADVFTTTPFAGNPCAVVFDADDLAPQEMLAIAKEMNLSETVFIKRSMQYDYRPFYYTPAEEIPLAGHPTIATAHALIATGRWQPRTYPATLSLQLTAAPVRVEAESGPSGLLFTMNQPAPKFLRQYPAAEVLPLFSLPPEAALAGAPIQTVSTGTPMLMIPVRGLAELKRAEMQVSAYRSFKSRGDFFSPHVFCLEGLTPDATTFARHFGLPPDTFEDPFTGSASGCMAAYLWHYGFLAAPHCVAEQGHWLGRPGRAHLEVVGSPDEIQSVRLKGQAVTTVRGEIYYYR